MVGSAYFRTRSAGAVRHASCVCGPAFAALAVVASMAFACGKSPKPSLECDVREIPADKSTNAPRPDETQASFSFHGNNPEQREFVFLHEDGSYDYAERWDFGVPDDQKLQAKIGWDWKVGCRMQLCPLPDGTVCCYQRCDDGGASGVGYEAPDQFDCMNRTDDGRYDWFLDGLRKNGKPELAVCLDAGKR